MKNSELLSQYFCDLYQLPPDEEALIEWVDAKNLLTSQRIDLIAKYKYVEFFDKGFDKSFITELYIDHIEAFTIGTFKEGGQETVKNSYRRYLQCFDALINGIKDTGMDENISAIPVGRDDAIMDGAHRTAISAYYGKRVPIVRFPALEPHNDAGFFRSRGLSDEMLDYLVCEYCKLRNNIYVACIWPRARDAIKIEKAEELLAKSANIVYKRDRKLSYNGLRNLFIQVYQSFDWLGGFEDHFSGASGYATTCYGPSELVRIYILEGNSLEEIKKVKDEIRKLFKIGNASIHMTDNIKEARQLANILLNDNTEHFLNYGKPDKFYDYNMKLETYKNLLIEYQKETDDFIVDSGGVLAAYGLRDSADIDYMTTSDSFDDIKNDYIENHHDWIKYYPTSIDNLVLNPRNYFYYNEIKFSSLQMVRQMKKKRSEPKDKHDVLLIDSVFSKQNPIRVKLVKWLIFWKRQLRILRTKWVSLLYVVYETKTYQFLLKIYHLLRDGKWH